MTRGQRIAWALLMVPYVAFCFIVLALYLAAIGIVELVGLGESW